MGRVPEGSPRMGRPEGSPRMGQREGSPRMNNNFNPTFHGQPTPESEPPVEEKWVVEGDKKYPNNSRMVNPPNPVFMGGSAQVPTYHNSGGTRGNQNTGVPIGTQVVIQLPAQPIYHNTGGMARHQHTGVPMARPPIMIQRSNWSSGLFDCMNDCENAVITCCFPFVTFGQIAEVIDEGATSCATGGMMYVLICICLWIPFVYTCTYRTKLRMRYGLPDVPAPDWILHCFCEYCALCQEYRELNHRGLDPAIGWLGNVQRQRMGQQQEMMTPPMGQRMMG